MVARATGRGADSSVGPGAPRQRPARHETRRRPGADPAPCAQAVRLGGVERHHLAQHHRWRRNSAPTPGSAPPKRRLQFAANSVPGCQLGRGGLWRTVFRNSTVISVRYSSEVPPRGASSQPSEREARTDTPTHPPSPRRAAPQPRASPSEGRPAATPHRDRRTRRGSKLPAGPPRRSAPHHQPPIGAEWPCDLPAVNSRIYFIFLEKNHLLLVNLKVANGPTLCLHKKGSLTTFVY